MNAWDFWNGNPFLAWCALWLLWSVVPLANTAFLMLNRVLRTIKVVARGWPPAGLDADGDFQHVGDSAEGAVP